MMNTFDPKLPYAYSFGPKGQQIMELFRSNIIGGITNVYRRLINLMDEDSPIRSRFSSLGERFTHFGFFDFNAMYCDSERQAMPLTPGILWEKKGRRYEKSLLLESKSASYVQMQWLFYMQEKEGYDKNGNFVQMEHAYHRGEKRINGYLPDGYIFKDGRHYIYEFLGCYHHAGCCIPNDQLRAGWEERKIFTDQKLHDLEGFGNLRVMRECQWKQQLADMEKPPTQMGRILFDNDNEETLLQAILNDEVFGFLEADVSTPDSVIEEMGEDFLFPFLFVKTEIGQEHLCPYTEQRFLEENRKPDRETIIQCFNAKSQLLLTDLVKFYHSRGLKITNLKRFIQYVPGKPFEPFVEKCYQSRVEATKANDTTRANTIKNVANNGYGKCLEQVSRHKRTVIVTDEDKAEELERKPFFVDFKEFVDENDECNAWEITMRKRKTKDDKPVHLALAILQHSKLLFLR